jgi:hypothetical protein
VGDAEGPAESGGGDFAAEAQKILYNVAKDLREAFKDLTALVVVTAAADTNAQIKLALKDVEFNNEIASNVTSMALTRMELDGDVYSMIPTKGNDPEIRAEVMTEHKQNITLATQNWNNFIDGVLKVVQIGATMAKVDIPLELLSRPSGSVHPALTR